MKKLKLLILILFLFFPSFIYAGEVNYEIDAFKIEANIKEDGSVDVCEFIKQTGTFNGYVRELVYKGTNNDYNASYISNINVYDLNINEMTKGDLFSLVSHGEKGQRKVYEMNYTYGGVDLTMYNKTNNSSSGYVLCYTLEDAVLIHNDVAEFYWNFIGNDFSDLLENVDIKVYLPNKDDSLRVWAHGPLYGEIWPKHDSRSYAHASIKYINSYNEVDVRMTFDKENVKYAKKLTHKDALDSILKEEEKLAEEANIERTISKIIVIAQIIILILYFGTITGIVIYCYFKYDKEHKVDFNHQYYRDFPNTYGPEILEYLNKKNITSLAYSASLLEIIRKKAIIVEKLSDKKDDYKLIINKNYNESLTEDEKLILDYIINDIGNGEFVLLKEIKNYGKSETKATHFINHYNKWVKSVKNSAQKYNFYEKSKHYWMIAIIIIFGFITGFLTASLSFILPGVILVIGVLSVVYLGLIKKRTTNGALEYAKWQAFKRFLEDFGRLDEKELPEIILWEKYLVYATVLGVADNLEKTMKIKIEQMNLENSTTISDIYFTNYVINSNINSTISNTLSKAIATSHSTIASSSSSSSGGFGGGFSSGGGFGGGGGGGHGF